MNGFFSIEFQCPFEHICSTDKVNAKILVTSSSVGFECLNCHKKIFYRRVVLSNDTDNKQ